MATAPYQLWIDCPAPVTAQRSSNVLTVTLTSAHSLVVGSVVQIADTANLGGINGVYTVATTPSSTSFTVASSGTDGYAKVKGVNSDGADGYAVISQDIFNPLINYASAYRPSALYVPTESLQMASSGDGVGVTMSLSVMQDDTPAVGAWYTLMPDEARVRLVVADTGTVPSADKVIFLGTVSSVSARLQGSGQGTTTDVSLQDNNAVLDRLVVMGMARQPSYADRLNRISNVVTATFSRGTRLAVGDSFTVSLGIGGRGTSFNGTFQVASTVSGGFTYAQTGANATMSVGTSVAINTVARAGTKGTALKQFLITVTDGHGLSDKQPIEIEGVNTSSGSADNQINRPHEGTAVSVINSTQFRITVGTALPAFTVSATGRIKSYTGAYVTPTDTSIPSVGLGFGVTEDSAVGKLLDYAGVSTDEDYARARLVDLSDKSKIVAGAQPNSIGVSFPAGTLRSCLDSAVEAFGGQDGKIRRYWVDLQRRINYVLVDPASVPASATAPYKIVTSGTQDPNTTSAAATIYASDLQVQWDHQTTKGALVAASAGSNSTVIAPRRSTYVSSGYDLRPGSPIFEEIVEVPAGSTSANLSGLLVRVAKAFFLENHKPLLTGSFTVRGKGTQSFNQYGYANGGYAVISGTPTLVTGWQPGQWVDISCAELNLSGLYRIESVEYGYESGSYIAYAQITFNRRPPNALTAILNKKG